MSIGDIIMQVGMDGISGENFGGVALGGFDIGDGNGIVGTGGADFYYVTLQPARTDEEEDAQGGFWSTSFFDVFVDIRIGALNGSILLQSDILVFQLF